LVVGLDRFKAQFAGFEAQYALIGGAACEVLMEQAGLGFRATKDLDIVLCVETMDAAFTRLFLEFVEAGGYEQRERSSGDKEFYRFIKPKDPSYPHMLELFSRKPDAITLGPNSYLTPIPVEEAIASLSAILLDDAYYALLTAGTTVVDGVSVLNAATLIPFKAFAYLNLSKTKDEGGRVDQRDIAKHRNDVFRLLQLLAAGSVIALPDRIKTDLATFAERVAADPTFTPKDFGLRPPGAEQIARLREAYGL
jgi:hypothetical protein